MSLFDDKDDSILEIPVFMRIQTKTNRLIIEDHQKIQSISTETTDQIQTNYEVINQTFTIDDDSNDNKSLHLSPIDASNDSIEILSYSPIAQKRDINHVEEDNEWSDCQTSCDNSSPIKANFISRTPFLKKAKYKAKSSVKKVVKNNRKEELINERMAQKEEKERARNERKVENELTKIREKANKQVLKSKDIKQSLKYCNAIIDNNLYEMAQQSIDEIFVAKEAKYRLTDNPLVPLSVTWVRKHLNLIEQTDSSGHSSQASVADHEVEENYILVLIEADAFIQRVDAFVTKSGETLFDFVKNIKFRSSKTNLTLLVYKLEQYFKRQKSKSHNEFRQRFNELYHNETASQPNRRQNKSNSLPSVTRDDVDLALIDMELKLMELDSDFKVSVIKANDSSEIATYIFRYTRSVAESFGRREKKSQQNFSWFADADNRNTVDPIDDQSFQKLWKKQLMQFPKISYDVANAIVMKYPTPKSLLEAYSRVSQPELLLSDIVVTRRQPNGTNTERKIGRELSVRVHLFMTSKKWRRIIESLV